MANQLVIGPETDKISDLPEDSYSVTTDFTRPQIMEILNNVRTITPQLDTFETEDVGESSVLVTVEQGTTLDELGYTYWDILIPALRDWCDAGNPLTPKEY